MYTFKNNVISSEERKIPHGTKYVLFNIYKLSPENVSFLHIALLYVISHYIQYLNEIFFPRGDFHLFLPNLMKYVKFCLWVCDSHRYLLFSWSLDVDYPISPRICLTFSCTKLFNRSSGLTGAFGNLSWRVHFQWPSSRRPKTCFPFLFANFPKKATFDLRHRVQNVAKLSRGTQPRWSFG